MKDKGEVPKSAYSKASGQSVVTLDVSVEARVAEIEGRTNVTNPPPHQTKTQNPTSVATDVGMIGKGTEANNQPALAPSVPKEIWNELIVALKAYQCERDNNPTFHKADLLSRGYSKVEKIGAVDKLINMLVEPNNFEMFTLREYESLCGGKVKTILDSHAFTPLNIMELIKTDLTRQLQETNSSLDLMGLQVNEQSVALQQKHAELGEEQSKVQGLQAQVEHLDLKYAKEKLQFEKEISHLGETQAAEKARLHADFQVAQKKYTTAESQLKIQVAAALKETAGLKTKLEIKTQNFISLTQSFRDLSAGFYQANNRVNALNEALKTATSLNKQEKAQFSADLIALNSARYAVDDKLLSTEKQLVNVKGKNDSLQKRITVLMASQVDLTRQLSAAKGNSSALAAQIETLKAAQAVELIRLKSASEEDKVQLIKTHRVFTGELTTQLEQNKITINAQSSELAIQRQTLSESLAANTRYQADIEVLKARVTSDSEVAGELLAERDLQHAAQLLLLNARLESTATQLEEAKQSAAAKSALNDETQLALAAQLNENKELLAANKRLGLELEIRQEGNSSVTEINPELLAWKGRQEKFTEELYDENHALNAEMDALKVAHKLELVRLKNVSKQDMAAPIFTDKERLTQLGTNDVPDSTEEDTLMKNGAVALSALRPPMSDRWHRFYAEYKPEEDAEADNSAYTNEALFRRTSSSVDSEHGILFAVNMNHKKMTNAFIEQFEKGAVPVICPTSGHEYSLSFKGKIPVAILKAENAQKFPGDTDDEHLQRRAATIINMIDNVLAKSEEITITTSDPFLAEIASSYLAHLQTIKDVTGAQVLTMNAKPLTSNASKQEKDKAESIFKKLNMPADDIQRAQWFVDAVAFRAELPHSGAQPI